MHARHAHHLELAPIRHHEPHLLTLARVRLSGMQCENPTPRPGVPGSVRVYNCQKCPGYCCSYPLIALTRRDVERLARHFELEFAQAERRFTRTAWGHKWTMRRKPDKYFGRICRFFDTKLRRCTVYQARPAVCRSFPGKSRCGYYDFLRFERLAQKDEEYVALTTHR